MIRPKNKNMTEQPVRLVGRHLCIKTMANWQRKSPSVFQYFGLTLIGGILLISNNLCAQSKPSSCQKIRDACIAAGFKKDLHVKNDDESKCSKKILNGEKVQGVNVATSDIKVCELKHLAHQAKRAAGD